MPSVLLVTPPTESTNSGEEREYTVVQSCSDGEKSISFFPPYRRNFPPFCPRLKLADNPQIMETIESEPVNKPKSLVDFYPMKSQPHAIIINNEHFTEKRHGKREGTDRDEDNLVETFRFLGYRVEVHRECKREEIESLFDNMKNIVKEEDDSFICCILSHGDENIIFGVDSKPVNVRTVQDSLEMKLSACRSLYGKPKIFFVSTCRGKKGRQGVPVRRLQHDTDEVIPTRADFIFNFATLPGEKSWRDKLTGTFYISSLCHFLCKHATHATLTEIQRLVAKEVTKIQIQPGNEIILQMPALEEQTTSNVYFFDDFFVTAR